MNKILVLGAGQMQVPVIKKIRERGDYCIVVDYDRDAPGMKYANIALNVSSNDKEAILRVAREHRINGILTTSDYPVNIVAYVAKELSLPSMSIEVAEICTNKYMQRNIFCQNRINTPFYKLINQESDLAGLIDFPYIMKPVDSSASRGVKKINTTEDLLDYYQIAFSFSKQGSVIVEKFIEGREFSVEALTQSGITTLVAITEKTTKGEQLGFFVEDTHVVPADLSKEETSLIKNEVLKAIKVIGIDNCPTHTEVKLNAGGAYIIEIACRLGGDYIASDLVPLATGVDMLENLIRISTDEIIDVVPKIHGFAAIQFLNQENYYKCVDFVKRIGKQVIKNEIGVKHDRTIASSLDRMGYIIIQTSTREEINSVLSSIN